MRKQIRGLTQASANAEDGISAVQTAEGALTEVHDMLQRMNELCVQAANGTNATSDRQKIQDEVNQVITEIDRREEFSDCARKCLSGMMCRNEKYASSLILC